MPNKRTDRRPLDTLSDQGQVAPRDHDSLPTKRALLIGIDKYELQPAVIKPLQGCCNDVDLMRSILVSQYGFDPELITVLKNAEATQAAIEAAFTKLVSKTRKNDIVVVHYAGHGSLAFNSSGEEASGFDSTIVPVDSGRDPLPSTDITDETINEWLTELGGKTPFTTLIFDSCHSGTITRDIFGAQARSAPPDMRGAHGHAGGLSSSAGRSTGASSRSVSRGAGPSPADPDTYVVISGCRDDEQSFEYCDPQGVSHGTLTYFLSRELQRPGRKSYRDMFEVLAPSVTAYMGQHPQLAGRADAEVFGVNLLPPLQYVLVNGLAPDGAAIELAAGAAQRVTVGSLYDVYREGTGKPTDADLLGRVRVARVYAVHADAEPVGPTLVSAFPVSARAVEVEHAYGDLRLGVQLAQSVTESKLPEAVTLIEALRASRKLHLVEAGSYNARSASVVLHLIGPRQTVGPDDAIPRLGAIDTHTWVMADGKGDPVGPIKPFSEYEQVATNLDALANYRDTLALENPDPTSELHEKFVLELTRRVPGADAPAGMKPEDFAWVAALPNTRGETVLEEDEFISFRVTSKHDKPVFINLLSLGFDGKITVLYPRASDASPILAARGGINIRQQSRKGFQLEFTSPHSFPGDASREETVGGVETVKLFVTEREARFEGVQQESMRSIAERSTVEGLMRRAYDAAPRSNPARAIRVDDPPPPIAVPLRAEGWTTVMRRFVIRKRGAGATPVGIPNAAATGATPVSIAGTKTAESPAREALARALSGPGFTVQQKFEILQPPATPGGRSMSMNSHVEVPAPGSDHGQMLLATDESGMMSWHFERSGGKQVGLTRGVGDGAATRSYDVPVPPRDLGGPEGRGMVSLVARKVLEVVAFPLIQDGIKILSDHFLPQWEAKRHPYGVRTFTPNDYTLPAGRKVEGAELVAGRALLMIHGTFSSAHASFGALEKSAVERLNRKYEGRVFAFNHLTLSEDPRENAAWLLDQLPHSGVLDVDIVCHSRGGLVGRMLAERQEELSRTVRVGKVVFVGSPNAGTQLADPQHIGKFIDAYTNILSFVPTNGITEVLEGILTAAKVVAVGAVKGLRGLQSMHPLGDFLRTLNAKMPAGTGADVREKGAAAGDTKYFALSSDFSPHPRRPALTALLANRVMDRVFKEAKNDLVVPTDSVFAENGARRFPITETKMFSGDDAVAHTEFFANERVRQQLLDWLGA